MFIKIRICHVFFFINHGCFSYIFYKNAICHTSLLKKKVVAIFSGPYFKLWSDCSEKNQMMRFFNWFFFFSLGSLLAVTVLLYTSRTTTNWAAAGATAPAPPPSPPASSSSSPEPAGPQLPLQEAGGEPAHAERCRRRATWRPLSHRPRHALRHRRR